MGKRELLIISVFIVIGVVAYQFTAPPAGDSSGFSLTTVFERFRRGVRGNRAMATVTTTGMIEVAKTLEEVRISGIAHVKLVGESRQDIEYTLTVESNGPDETIARDFAGRAALTQDNLGPVLALRATYPREMRQVATLSLAVPSRLSFRVEGGQGGSTMEVANVAGMQLDAVVGDVRLSRVNGPISGNHRNGELSINESRSVSLTVVSSKATLESVAGDITLVARNGQCHIIDPKGRIDLESTNQEIRITNPAGEVRIRGTGGRLAIEDPRNEVNVDVRRVAVNVGLSRPVPLTILTADAPLELGLTGPPAIMLDAVATESTIDATAFPLAVETVNQESRVHHAFGAASAPVALRNRRAAIVIGWTK